MRHPYFYKAITDAYEQLIPVGEQISFFLYFEVDPANIDVNIHPTKTEIKFENEQAIWQILSAAVKEALGRFNAIPSIDFDMEGMPDIPVIGADRPIAPPQVNIDRDYNPFKTSSGASYSRSNVDWEDLYAGFESKSSASHSVSMPANEDDFISMEQPGDSAVIATNLYGSNASTEKSSQHFQYKGRYILTSVKSGLMMIDQHRAHIRVLFEQYINQIRNKQGVSQGVLFPEIIQLPSSEATVLLSIIDDISAIGFEVTDLGGGSYAINGVPSGIEGLNPVELIRNMVHTAMEKGSDVKEEIQNMLALTMARSAAIVYGQVLSDEEMRCLVDNLFATPAPNHTPDGHTILATIKEEDIERLFK